MLLNEIPKCTAATECILMSNLTVFVCTTSTIPIPNFNNIGMSALSLWTYLRRRWERKKKRDDLNDTSIEISYSTAFHSNNCSLGNHKTTELKCEKKINSHNVFYKNLCMLLRWVFRKKNFLKRWKNWAWETSSFDLSLLVKHFCQVSKTFFFLSHLKGSLV